MIWDWQRVEPSESSSSAVRPRLRGTLQAAAGMGVGIVFFLLGARILSAVALTVAAILWLSALLSPNGLYAAIDRAFHALGRWVGQALSWLLLPAIFYLFFLPFGWLFRRGKRDTMKRSFDTEADTYWQPHREVAAAKSYRRQF